MSIAIAATVAAAALVAAAGQEQTAPAKTAEPAKKWTPVRTPDGAPDLQGIWTNYTGTPFEVPDKGDRPDFYAGDLDGTGRGTGPSAFLTDSTDRQLTKARSLVVDPPNGRIPWLPGAKHGEAVQYAASRRLVPAQRQRLAVRTGMARVHVEFAAVIAFLNQQRAAGQTRAEFIADGIAHDLRPLAQRSSSSTCASM